jgi:Fic family protein
VETARFVPISAERVPDAMSAWERYLHADAPDKLIQLAILHAEFEAIHPFLDGNGRLGRLLVSLYLVDKRLLSSPNFYVSAYLEAHRDEYYKGLLAVSRDHDWASWCVFFLTAILDHRPDPFSACGQSAGLVLQSANLYDAGFHRLVGHPQADREPDRPDSA